MDLLFLIEPGKALDPNKYFIVATDMFQNGLSSSPGIKLLTMATKFSSLIFY